MDETVAVHQASGHGWRLARERSTNDCQADVCEAYGPTGWCA